VVFRRFLRSARPYSQRLDIADAAEGRKPCRTQVPATRHGA